MKAVATALLGAIIMTSAAQAGIEAFHPGPAIPEFGNIADVQNDFAIEEGMVFRVAFDIADQADPGTVNRNMNSAARFINMHVAAGVPLENQHLALVIHGGAVRDVTNAARYAEVADEPNATAALIEALVANGVRIYVCGQSAAYSDVANEDLLPGVTMALSAMTAHAQLAAEGQFLNPF